MVQRICPESSVDLFATLELHEGRNPRRALELQVTSETLEVTDAVSGTRQVAASIEAREDGRSALVLALDDAGVSDLFAAMCGDVAEATASKSDDEDAVATWIGRFTKWRRMLQGGSDGLTARRQRGLFAELLTIREHLLPHVGFDEAIGAWKGPDGAPRDFELRGCGLEVKSSAANEPQVVPVHGERQLDGSGLVALLLVHQSLEVLRDAGETLPMIVADLRASGSGLPEAGTFEDRLLQSGYLDMHEPRYRRTGYAIRRTSVFEIRSGFPRITEDDLVDGIGAVRYSLAIDACRDFEVDESRLTSRLASRGRQPSESS
jgi:hypothetical protein